MTRCRNTIALLPLLLAIGTHLPRSVHLALEHGPASHSCGSHVHTCAPDHVPAPAEEHSDLFDQCDVCKLLATVSVVPTQPLVLVGLASMVASPVFEPTDPAIEARPDPITARGPPLR